MLERGLDIDHSTINRWVIQYSPELDKRIRQHLKSTDDSWRVDETYVKIRKKWRYLYRAVDSDGNTLDFLLTAKRDIKAAKRLLTKALNASHTHEPRVINVDKNPAYPPAIEQLQKKERIPEGEKTRQVKYLNNIVEQDHHGIKSLVNPGMGFGSFNLARRTLKGYEAMNMICKGQIKNIGEGDVMGQISFINKIFGLAA